MFRAGRMGKSDGWRVIRQMLSAYNQVRRLRATVVLSVGQSQKTSKVQALATGIALLEQAVSGMNFSEDERHAALKILRSKEQFCLKLAKIEAKHLQRNGNKSSESFASNQQIQLAVMACVRSELTKLHTKAANRRSGYSDWKTRVHGSFKGGN